MPKYNPFTDKYELTEKEREQMAVKKKDFGQFIIPDRYTPEQETEQTTSWETTTGPQEFTRLGGQTGRIEIQREGEQRILRDLPIPPPQPEAPQPTSKPVWRIDALVCLKNGAGFKARVTEQVSGRQGDIGFEAYYDTYHFARGDVQAVGKLLLKKYEEQGIEVTAHRGTPKPDLMEEMYQLLSIMMIDPNIAEKYDSSWQTVKMQFDNSML